MASLWTSLVALPVVLVLLAPAAKAELPTVPELEADKYLGRWYQMYASPVIVDWFEKGGVCITADYAVNPNKTISVTNMQRDNSKADGPLNVKRGYATTTSDPGKLNVILQGVPAVAPYWVIKLGPKTFGDKGMYEYSVVTDNLSASLFVLARDVDRFRSKFQQEVLDFLQKEGFTKIYNKPLETTQTSDCVYGPTPTPPQ